MTTPAPQPAECQILQFRHLFKLKTRYDASKNTYIRPTNLIAVSSLHGLTFVGEQNNLKVVASNQIFQENCDFNSRTVISHYFHRDVPLPASPTHIDINSEQKLLAVTYCNQNVPILRVYTIESFFTENVIHYPEIRLSSTDGTYVTDLSWNPGIPNVLACCVSDGTLSTYTYNSYGQFEIKSLPKESNSVCICWSPKGKQIVVGSYTGHLTQYVPELKAMKTFAPPPNLFTKACTLCSVKWLSNFQFIGVYKTQEENLSEDEEIKSCVVVINTPKNGPVSYINYDDICFSNGTERPVQFYFTHIPNWNLIFVSSSNSVEVAVLNLSKDGVTWIPWNLEPEENRITLPIIKSGEAFPVGVAIDYSSSFQTPIGDKIVSMPVLLVMTWEGLTCVYLINFLDPSVPDVCIKTNATPSLQYFTSAPIADEEFIDNKPPVVEAAAPEVTSAQFAPPIPDMSAYTYTIEQSIPQAEDTNYDITVAEIANTLVQMPNTVSLLGNLNSSFNFETSIARAMTSESIPISITPSLPSQPQPLQKIPEQSNFNTPAQSNKSSSNVKKVESPKSRQEILKKFKKRASVFENDIQEIKYLVSNIKIDDSRAANQSRQNFTKLENNSKKLKEFNVTLRNEIDTLKTSIIETFACVQDVKSKYFQLKNPGYQSLSGVQDMDPISMNNMKTIENTINYVQTQVEKANKQLEETWFKFSQNPATSRTKVPLLENVYETMVKQQKILNYLKMQTEKLEKNFAAVFQRLSRDNSSISSGKLNSTAPWSRDRLLNESMSLDDLAKRALNLNTTDDLQPKVLAQKLSREYANKFHISCTKQMKLQELLSTGSVTYIQSSRLQRLKKKSLIILSKSLSVPETRETADEIKEREMENLRINMVSPVSSDDEKPSRVDSVISSTPLKSTVLPRFTMENTLPNEPSIIRQMAAVPTKPAFSLPSSITLTPIENKTKNESKIPEPVPVPALREIVVPTPKEAIPSSGDRTSLFSGFANTGSLFSHILQPSNTAATPLPIATHMATPTPAVRTTGAAVGTTDNLMANIKPTATATGSFFPNLPTTSLFSNTSAPTCPSVPPPPLVPTAISASTFSFAALKSETETTSAPSSFSTTGSIFGSKPAMTVTTSTVAASNSTSMSGDSLFAGFPPASGGLPSFGSLTSAGEATAISVAASSASEKAAAVSSTTPTAASTSAPTSSLFGGATSVFGKPSVPPTAINFGSALSSGSIFAGKAAPTAAPLISNQNTLPTTASQQKSVAFGAFSFANANKTPPRAVTISEVTPEGNGVEAKENKENVAAPATSFSFANIGSLSFTPVKSDSPAAVTAVPSANVTATLPLPASTTNSSSLFNTASVTSAANIAPANGSSAVSSTSNVAPGVIKSPSTAPPPSSTGAAFDNASSFFGGLNLSAPSTTNNPIFGKPAASPSTASSIFGGTGGNVFSQTASAAPVSSASESKPIFGSGNSTSLFMQNTAPVPENKNLFGSPSSNNFQSGGPLFGSAAGSGAPLFGSSSTFGSGSGGQPSAFGSNVGGGGSVFGSAGGGFNSPFQNTAGGFGAPPSFSGSMQQQGAAGFGSPPSFSTFGGAPTFGGSPSFGSSPTKVFGQPTTNMGVFGSANPQSATGFESLAHSENAVSFGNLAQQQPPSGGFGAPPTFQNTNTGSAFGSPKFGESTNAFNSWR